MSNVTPKGSDSALHLWISRSRKGSRFFYLFFFKSGESNGAPRTDSVNCLQLHLSWPRRAPIHSLVSIGRGFVSGLPSAVMVGQSVCCRPVTDNGAVSCSAFSTAGCYREPFFFGALFCSMCVLILTSPTHQHGSSLFLLPVAACFHRTGSKQQQSEDWRQEGWKNKNK